MFSYTLPIGVSKSNVNYLLQIWTPPTPPRDGQDEIYVDPTLAFLYETSPMVPSRLPPLYLTK